MDPRVLWTVVLMLAPFAGAASCVFLGRSPAARRAVVLATGALLIAAALALLGEAPFRLEIHPGLRAPLGITLMAADAALLAAFLYYGAKYRHAGILLLTLLQAAGLAVFKGVLTRSAAAPGGIVVDGLACLIVLVVSVVGALICFQALPYMDNHERHYGVSPSRQPRFFGVMLLFLGAMNGFVLFHDLSFLYAFFELTTLCSFLLIGHDRTHVAVRNALRALWMNSLSGVAFVLGMIEAFRSSGTLDLAGALAAPRLEGDATYFVALALLGIACLVKSAQFPFQGWLLGAMVAPTPVSALLHSSTMVKIGVYFLLRLAPGFPGSFLGQALALAGSFGFLAAAGLAVGHSNGKKVLAYSTISNLGLMFACIGVNTGSALLAATLLLAFHAVLKAMLFLSVGAIEQHIESRDIEDMRGLYTTMPLTALITLAGVVMMIFPPFGVLLGKWMAIEAVARHLPAVVMIALGSALTVLYWARWAGTLLSDPLGGRFHAERQPALTWLALGSLGLGGAALSVAAPWIVERGLAPIWHPAYGTAFAVVAGGLESATGAFAVLPLSLAAACGLALSAFSLHRAFGARRVPPYLSGLQTGEGASFRGPLQQAVRVAARNYYLDRLFGEDRLNPWVNLGGAILLTLILGGVL